MLLAVNTLVDALACASSSLGASFALTQQRDIFFTFTLSPSLLALPGQANACQRMLFALGSLHLMKCPLVARRYAVALLDHVNVGSQLGCQ